ncbi:hypothetical protein D3C72_1979480 [compost metagenome]
MQHLVRAKIARVGKTVARVGTNRMRACLVAQDAGRRLIGLVDGLNADGVGTIGSTEQIVAFSIGRQVSHAFCQGGLVQRSQVAVFGIYAVAQHLKRLDPQGCKQHFAVGGDGHGVDLITGVDLFNQAQRAVALVKAILGN